MPAVKVADVVIPEILGPYIQQYTQEKSRLVQSGIMVNSEYMNEMLTGGGQSFTIPSYHDLDSSDVSGKENISTDDISDIQEVTAASGDAFPRNDAVPKKISTGIESFVRMSRNQVYSATNLAGQLSGDDPMEAIGNRFGAYWVRRQQAAVIASIKGVFADNDAAPTGGDTHVAGDLTNNISAGGTFTDGVTNFSAGAFIDTTVTMGDSMEELGAIIVHSIVYSGMQKNNLINFVEHSNGLVRIPKFLNRTVIVDDSVPRTGNVFESWLFGAGALQFGSALDPKAVETSREALAGAGGGQDMLHSRVIWGIHPTGHAYIQSSVPGGGPSNTNLSTAANWSRRYTERKMIRVARLITTEYA